MKKLFITIIIIFIFFITGFTQVKAENSFYEGEYINNIWMVRKKSDHLIYQTARFLRRSSDNQFAYCIEPFAIIQNNQTYKETINPDSISKETWEKVSLIAYFGYGYNNHNDNKWYAITQMMIWKELDTTSDFYFTDSLNGNRIDIFTDEINEIKSLIKKYYNKPSFNNQTITTVLGSTLILNDQYQVLNSYKLTNNDKNILLENNILKIQASTLGKKEIYLESNENKYQVPPILYFHPTSQNIMTVGTIPKTTAKLTIETIETEVTINKIDKDTKTKENSGEAKLEGAVYEIYNQNNELISKLIINEDKEASIKNLSFGNYYIKETSSGVGYKLDNKTYEFTISKDTPNINLQLENEVIKQKIEIYKKYGNPTSNNMQPEENITFKIYDINNNYINSITTDKKGYATIILPYGTYIVKQNNTTEGYQKIDDFRITINENSDKIITYNLDNLEIPVPNTKEDKKYNDLFLVLLIGAINIYYVKKDIYNSITATS